MAWGKAKVAGSVGTSSSGGGGKALTEKEMQEQLKRDKEEMEKTREAEQALAEERMRMEECNDAVADVQSRVH